MEESREKEEERMRALVTVDDREEALSITFPLQTASQLPALEFDTMTTYLEAV